MATISTCPRCSRLITLPEGYGSGAPMRCPLCRAEYPLGEALALVPPALIPVVEGDRSDLPRSGPEAGTMLAWSSHKSDLSPLGCLPSETATDFLADLARHEESYGAAPAAGTETPAAESAPFDAAQFTPIITEPPAESGATPLPGRRKRKSKSAKRIFLEMIFGGVGGLLIAYYALWWIRGEACGLPRIPWLPLLPPAHSTDNGINK